MVRLFVTSGSDQMGRGMIVHPSMSMVGKFNRTQATDKGEANLQPGNRPPRTYKRTDRTTQS